jgi:hypothetical protein
MSSSRENSKITEFGIQLDRLIAKLKEPMTIAAYTELTGLAYKYISQLRTKPDRRPGSYAIVRLLKPFVDFKVLSINEALQFSKITRGKILTLNECKGLFPTMSDTDLRHVINAALQSGNHAAIEAKEITIFENNYSVPLPVIEFIRQENPRVVKILEHSGTLGRHYIDEIKTLDSKIKQIRLLIHNPLEQMISELQKERTCEQIRTLKLVDFKSDDVLKIRCYNQFASLQGEKFGDELIVLGWYTYYYDPNYPEYGKHQIWGHNNPLIVANLKNESKCLGEMFDRVFDSLWNDKENPSLLTVCTKHCKLYQERGKPAAGKEHCPVSEDWLKKVSG